MKAIIKLIAMVVYAIFGRSKSQEADISNKKYVWKDPEKKRESFNIDVDISPVSSRFEKLSLRERLNLVAFFIFALSVGVFIFNNFFTFRVYSDLTNISIGLFILSVTIFSFNKMFASEKSAPQNFDPAATIETKQPNRSKYTSDESTNPAEVEETDDDNQIRREQIRANVYTIRLNKTHKFDSEKIYDFSQKLLSSFPNFSLMIHANNREIRWMLLDEIGISPEVVERTIRSHYSQAEIFVTPFQEVSVDEPFYRYVAMYQHANMFIAPMKLVGDIKRNDPLTSLVHTMSGLHDGERITYMISFGGQALDAYDEARKLITQSTVHPLQMISRRGIGDAIGKKLTNTDRTKKFEGQHQRIFEAKLSENLLNAKLLFQVDAPTPERVIELTISLDNEIANFVNMPYNSLHFVERMPENYMVHVQTQNDNRDSHILEMRQQSPRLILDPREVGALWHLPHEGFEASRIQWSKHIVPVPEQVSQLKNGIHLGEGMYDGRYIPVRIPSEDRATHINIVGKTGTGKSNFMHHLIHQDIAAGHGVAVIDPHGKLVQDILEKSIPEGREDDVVLLDLADRNYPPPMNPLKQDHAYAGVLRVVNIIERLFMGTEQAVRTSMYLRAALLLLQSETKVPTMRDIPRIFLDDVYRRELLERTESMEAIEVWEEQYNPASAGHKRHISEPIISRIRPFYSNPYLYPVLCHPDSLNFRSLIDRNKIILISLAISGDTVPDQERNLLGAFLMSRLQMAGMKETRNEPYFIYVDEVQKFVTTSLAEVFSEARKYGLSLTVANQFLGQLEGNTLDAVLGNAGATVTFRCSPEDTRRLGSYMKPEFKAEDLANLDRFQAAVRMQVHHQTQPPFTLYPYEPIAEHEDSKQRAERIRRKARENYTSKTREDVKQWLRDRYPRRRTQEPVKKKDDIADDFIE